MVNDVKRCGKGENVCKCEKPKDCGYLFSHDEDDCGMFHFCPNCDREYNEIDYEYQLCSHCKFDADLADFTE